MSDLNKVMIIGRLGQDPETRYTASGSAITNISVATSDRWTDKDSGEKKERTEWHKVTFFGRLAEVVGEYASKGKQVFVEGKLQTDKWTDRGGTDHYTTKIIGSDVQFLGGRSEKKEDSAPAQGGFRDKPAETSESKPDEDDIPF